MKRRRAEFNYRRWAKLTLLAGIVLAIYQMWPWVDCVYEVADAYQLGEGVVVDESAEAVRSAYEAERQELARQAARSGSYLAAVQFGAKECWGLVGFGYNRPVVLTQVMVGCFGAFVLLVIYGRFHRPRWKRELRRTREDVDHHMAAGRRHPAPRVRSSEAIPIDVEPREPRPRSAPPRRPGATAPSGPAPLGPRPDPRVGPAPSSRTAPSPGPSPPRAPSQATSPPLGPPPLGPPPPDRRPIRPTETDRVARSPQEADSATDDRTGRDHPK